MFGKKKTSPELELTPYQKMIKAVIKLALILGAQVVFIGVLLLLNDPDSPPPFDEYNVNKAEIIGGAKK